jgi:hypothetical protein
MQDPSLNIIEKAWDGKGWYNGNLNFACPIVRANLAVVSWVNGPARIRVYYNAPGDTVLEKGYDGNGWYQGDFNQKSVPASNIAAITLNNTPNLRVYLQNGVDNTAVSEFAWVGHWTPGQTALPPA